VVGIINDDSSPVGVRHFGVVLRYEVSDSPAWNAPKRNEKSITKLRWVDPSKGSGKLFKFEYWSQLCLIALYHDAAITRPTYTIRRRSPFRPPHLVIVIGELGSGKSMTTQILKEDYSYIEVNSGQVLAELLMLPAVTPQSRGAFQAAAWEFINSADGPGQLAEALWRAVRTIGTGRVLIDGIRQRKTLDEVRAKAGALRVGVVYVHSPPFLAFEFIAGRSALRVEDAIAMRNASVEREVRDMIALADVVLFNWQGRMAYQQAVRRLMRELGISQ
jgi:dephospho-CoA kinase